MRRAPLPTSGCSRQFDEFFLKFRKRKLYYVILLYLLILISLKNWFHGIFFNLPEVVPDFKSKGASIMIFVTNSHHGYIILFREV